MDDNNCFGKSGSTLADAFGIYSYTNEIPDIIPPPAPFSPTNITGLNLWYDASDNSSITLSGSTVSTWNDKSGNNYNLSGYSTYNQATVSSAIQNGKNAINFSGNGVYKGPINSACYPIDLYVVLALKDLTTIVDVCSINSNNGINNFNSLTYAEAQAKRWMNGSDNFNRTPNTVSSTDETSTGFILMNWSIANNNYILRRNTVQLSSTASYTFSLTALSIFQIGARSSTTNDPVPDHPFKGYIAEIVAYNTQLSDPNRSLVETYLRTKWGI